MLRSINTKCLLAATITWLLTSAAAGLRGAAPPDESALPDAAGSVEAWMAARQWVSRFDTPAPDSEDARVRIPGARAVMVLLRQSGRVVGLGTDAQGDDLMVRRAVGRALGDLLTESAVQTLPEELRPEVGRNLTLELEVAGELIPLVGRSFGDIAQRISPGLDGVAIRRGERWVYRFPAEMRAFNNARDIERWLPAVMAEVGVQPGNRTLSQIREQDGVSIYEFQTTHLAQRSAQGMPFSTWRGQQVVPESDVTKLRLERFADELASHLMQHNIGAAPAAPDHTRLFGDYLPASDDYRPLVAPPLEQALASSALSIYAKAPGVDPQRAADARGLSEGLLADLAAYEPDPASDRATAAAIVFAVLELPNQPPSPDIARLLERSSQTIRASFDPATESFALESGGDGIARAIPVQTRAMIAAAIARLHRVWPREFNREMASKALNAAWSSVSEIEQISLMPWIGWGELEYTASSGADEHTERTSSLLALLSASQVPAGPASEPDLIGGYALASGGQVLPTAQGLRPAAWLSRRLSRPDLVHDDDLAIVLADQLAFARFLLQLAVSEADLWAYRSPTRAVGGVRNAPWDNEMAVPAQALGLIVACDLLRGIERFETLDKGRQSTSK